jgi:hypothetical protein
LEKLSQLLIKHNFQKRDQQSAVSIAEIEALISFKLPDDYIFYLENFSSFDDFIGVEYVILWDLDNLIENNVQCRIIENMPGMLGIGENGSSEFLGIEFLDNGDCKAVISPLIDLDK